MAARVLLFRERVQAIDAIHRACAARSDVIGLAGGLPDASLFPREAMRAALSAVMSDPKLAALQYGWPEGEESLRAWIAARLSTSARPLDAGDVIVTAGAQQAIALAIDALASRGSTIGVGDSTYPAALELFRARGLVATDDARADAFYLVPEIGNPTGLPVDASYAASVRASGAPVISDAAYAELRFDGERTDELGWSPATWRIGTFAKTLCPGLRIGFVVPPREYRALVLRLKHDADLQASGLGQAVLVELLRRFDYDEHLRRTRAVYRRRADALASALRRHLSSWKFAEALGGFSLFVDTGEPGNDVAFLASASAHGVSFDPGRIFRPRERDTIELRVCYSNLGESLIAEGVERLARAFTAYTCASPR